MSEKMNLVSNLNEIMEEYAKREEETVQAAQAETEQSEEMGEVSGELEQAVEESRKRKRVAEETNVERIE